MVATNSYFDARGSTIFRRPCPGFVSSWILTSPNDVRILTSRFTAVRSLLRTIARSETGAGFLRTAWSTRTRCVVSARSKSDGSSKVSRISVGSFVPRSSLRARFSDLSKKASTVPVLTLRFLGVFFIFFSQQRLYFFLKSNGQGFVALKLDRFHFAHEMPVVITVAVVVAKHPAIIYSTGEVIDVGKIDFVTLPSCVCHTSSLSLAPRLLRFNMIVSSTIFSPRDRLGAFLATSSSLAQMRHHMTHLSQGQQSK